MELFLYPKVNYERMKKSVRNKHPNGLLYNQIIRSTIINYSNARQSNSMEIIKKLSYIIFLVYLQHIFI